MPNLFPYGITVTVQRGTTDRYGDMTWTDHHDVHPCAVAWRGTPTEETDRRDAATFSMTLLAPPGADVGYDDRIKLPDGEVWQVDGPPADWSRYRHPMTGWQPPGMEIVLKRVEG